MVGASALGLPFLYTQLGSGSWTGRPLSRARTPLKLDFTPQEAGVLSVLQQQSRGVYLLGGAVLAKCAGNELPFLNLLVDSKNFTQIKNDLFRFGVSPISTPELPSSFIRFVYADQAYSVMNMELDPFLKQNTLGQQLKLLPLAHNFLVFSASESWVLDPYEALQAPGGQSGALRMKLVQEPKSKIMALELCLAMAFDNSLLGLQFPLKHGAFEKRALSATVEESREAAVIVHQMLSYFPDLLELRGLDITRKYLLSPLCATAASNGPGIDLRKVDASLRTLDRRGETITSAHLVEAINDQFCRTGRISVFGTGIPDYMAANQMPVRRTDLLAQALQDPPATAQG